MIRGPPQSRPPPLQSNRECHLGLSKLGKDHGTAAEEVADGEVDGLEVESCCELIIEKITSLGISR